MIVLNGGSVCTLHRHNPGGCHGLPEHLFSPFASRTARLLSVISCSAPKAKAMDIAKLCHDQTWLIKEQADHGRSLVLTGLLRFVAFFPHIFVWGSCFLLCRYHCQHRAGTEALISQSACSSRLTANRSPCFWPAFTCCRPPLPALTRFW